MPWAVAHVYACVKTYAGLCGLSDESGCWRGTKPLLEVSRELGVLTWEIDTPQGRNLGDKPSERSWHT